MPMTQNVWEMEAAKDLMQSEKTRNMILSETDMERLSKWLKAAARSGSEEDFLDRIQ